LRFAAAGPWTEAARSSTRAPEPAHVPGSAAPPAPTTWTPRRSPSSSGIPEGSGRTPCYARHATARTTRWPRRPLRSPGRRRQKSQSEHAEGWSLRKTGGLLQKGKRCSLGRTRIHHKSPRVRSVASGMSERSSSLAASRARRASTHPRTCEKSAARPDSARTRPSHTGPNSWTLTGSGGATASSTRSRSRWIGAADWIRSSRQ